MRAAVANRLCRLRGIAAAVLAATMLSGDAIAQGAPEYNVKAGYLLLFARYVQWPEHAFTSNDAPLVIGVLGNDPFGDALGDTLRDQYVGSHPVEWVRMRELAPSDSVHLLFIAGRQVRDERRWLAALRDRPVLRVGESPESLQDGAIVRFVADGGRIRFDVDYAAAARSQLRVLSPMLVSARQVHGAPPNVREPGGGP